MDEIERNLMENSPTNKVIKSLIDDHRKSSIKTAKLFSEYKGDVAIKRRCLPDPLKLNNKLSNDFRGQIVDSVVGYMFGVPISYTLDRNSYAEAEEELFIKHSNILQDFIRRNNIADIDSRTGKFNTVSGYSGRLLFIDKEGNERVTYVPPWECIFSENGSTGDPQYAIRYYKVEVETDKGVEERFKVEFYDSRFLTVFLQDHQGDYPLHEAPRLHLFDGVPLIKFVNNDEEMGDFEKVESLIDAYDLLLSDAQNEVEEFRNAYMVFSGVEVDQHFMDASRQTGAIQLPDNANATFLTKQINDTFLENQKASIEDNIYRFTSSVNYSDEGFSGSGVSGESRKWKLLSLENKCITKERKFATGLMQMFKVLCSAWRKKGYDINYMHLIFQFTRNLPVDLHHYTEVATKLKGNVSETTRLGLLPFVPDIQREKDLMEAEKDSPKEE